MPHPTESLVGLPLTRRQRDHQGRLQLSYWLRSASGAQEVVIEGESAVAFMPEADREQATSLLAGLRGCTLRPLALSTLSHEPVCALYADNLADWHEALSRLHQAGIALMEEDIRPVDRYLIERGIFAGARVIHKDGRVALTRDPFIPSLRQLSLDIETTLRADRILSIALQCGEQEVVLFNGDISTSPGMIACAGERALLTALMEQVRRMDPDLLIGWNVIGFDLRVLEQRARALGIRLCLGRDDQPLRVEPSQTGRWFARLNGRVVLDGIDTLKGATWQFERYSLEFVARELLGRGKLIHDPEDRGEEIQRLYREEPEALARYNLEDCRLVTEIFKKAGLIPYLLERARLTGLALDKVGGSSQAFDNLYLPRLHRAGFVAPKYASGQGDLDVPGGFVMESRPGLYRHVLVLDFKSLYPSIIRSFQIDPLGLAMGTRGDAPADALVPGFHHAIFDRRHALLPAIIERLWHARDAAKCEGNSALSQAIKIQMNACYGVLGSRVCRFFDQRLSGSITLRGHQILQQTADHIEATYGHTVIYGDTDSVFVWLGDDWPDHETDAYGQRLATELNRWWRDQLRQRFDIDSALELQYEAHYSRFLMPRMRHSEKGSKKRYAGLKRQADGNESMVFRGLESVRTDWTPLAREFQQTLYECIFHDRPWRYMLQQRVRAVFSGDCDRDLVYRRRIRQPLEAYVRNRPPHVRAAQQLEDDRRRQGLPAAYRVGDSVAYVMTVNGPEPVELLRSPIDYQHYIDKQLLPVADTILPFIGESFAQLVAPQIDLF
ncbi:DNA polymerase II [Marinobacterium sediminicola]|uniref:DNA polymerase n=1 Tax=Marinobacterium sediminicola TaxID=518898 RepID=A0ABY1RY76_9GAMM|nr:DNA polymerase II [Marinobacterium sediminicola]ULG68582.1 DNA polymerase II [Marinobacterium sediminicola]SMR73100.1 DNA polymerase-2 [Marinobacterium sediminicola]